MKDTPKKSVKSVKSFKDKFLDFVAIIMNFISIGIIVFFAYCVSWILWKAFPLFMFLLLSLICVSIIVKVWNWAFNRTKERYRHIHPWLYDFFS
jgi:NhaP-type Na+/H+ or K+/H+ antiporter